ncbi:MAG: DUF4936 family protein [Thiobacillus sp.]|nr:DUF4936 family protein [Thiobacillus sp.]
MRDAYVYYRIVPALAAETARCVAALLVAMAPHCTRPPRLMQRCDDPDTWMEIYEGIADWPAFSAALHRCVAETRSAAGVIGGRQLECFCPRDAAR